jgi:hypothetical protein
VDIDEFGEHEHQALKGFRNIEQGQIVHYYNNHVNTKKKVAKGMNFFC